MKKSLKRWQTAGFLSSSLVGTLLHFGYELTGNSIFAAPFSGVNESTWEHMKLLFFPMLAFGIVQSFFFGKQTGFWCIKLKGTLMGISLIPILFYTYNGVIGTSPAWINILIFFISTATAYIYEARQFFGRSKVCRSDRLAFFTLLIIAALFVIFTFATPKINIFRDPTNGLYGI